MLAGASPGLPLQRALHMCIQNIIGHWRDAGQAPACSASVRCCTCTRCCCTGFLQSGATCAITLCSQSPNYGS